MSIHESHTLQPFHYWNRWQRLVLSELVQPFAGSMSVRHDIEKYGAPTVGNWGISASKRFPQPGAGSIPATGRLMLLGNPLRDHGRKGVGERSVLILCAHPPPSSYYGRRNILQTKWAVQGSNLRPWD
jgi:hypothetical protein